MSSRIRNRTLTRSLAIFEQAGIRFQHQPVEAVRLADANHDLRISSEASVKNLLLLPAEQLRQAGAQVETPPNGEIVLYEAREKLKGIINKSDQTFPKEVTLGQNGTAEKLRLSGMTAKYLMNTNISGDQLLAVNQAISLMLTFGLLIVAMLSSTKRVFSQKCKLTVRKTNFTMFVLCIE
ncbi:putative holin-like toxin [Paenibacillus lautus]|uniref:putative holin-like toxin n=1 Tax=Paenibacillus lautus TaxID=1401 RepID=UPI003D2965B9